MISLFGFDPHGPHPGVFHSIDGILHCIGNDAGRRLARLRDDFEMVWATGWEEKANEYLVHLLEMPSKLPVLTFGGQAVFGTAHWKLKAIDEYAGTRPAAWIDDSLDERCKSWAEGRAAPTLLVETDPGAGITDADVESLLTFAEQLARRP